MIGPRYVGKTVLLRQLGDRLLDEGANPCSVVYCNLSDERWPTPPSPRDIVRAAELRAGEGTRLFVLFDEIQVVPRWHAWLKLAVDESPHRYMVTGSAASALREGARESGLGRWDEVEIEALTYAEFCGLASGASTSWAGPERPDSTWLARYLALSGFPDHATEDSEASVRERVREDVMSRAIARDLLRLRVDIEQAGRLFLHLAENSGAILNVKDRAVDLHANRKSLSKWLTHLIDTRLLVELRPTTTRQGNGPGKAIRTLRGNQKVYVADHGLVSAFAPVPSPVLDPHFRAQMFEAVVFRHLREVRRTVSSSPELYARHGELQLSYWRDDRGEIDFVVDSHGGRTALEVTSSTKHASEKLAKFTAASKRSGATRRVLVSNAVATSEVGDVEIVPLEEFLLNTLRFVEPRL
jgi:predicted AAA+ superfamily ATPase